MNPPVHLQSDGAVDDGEAEHADPAQQDAPEGARLEVHDEDLQERECVVSTYEYDQLCNSYCY